FRFDNLAAGDYEVRISLPAGSGPTTPTSVWRTVDLQQAPSAVEFGYQRSQNGSVNGRVFFDNDADGAFNPGADDGRGGAIVELRDTGGALQATTTTAPDGQFQFSGLISGEYVLHLAVSGSPTTLDRPVSLPFSAPYASVHYALPPTDGQQRIVVFLDENGNETPDAGEQRFGGLTVQRDDVLCGGSFTVSDDAVTNSSGVALFSAPLNTFGCTRVRPGDMPAGAVPHDPYGIVLATTAGVLWLPLEPAGTLLVQPYWDADGNGLRGSGEPLLSGIQVSVGGTQATSGAAGATFSLGGSTHSVSVQPPGNMLVGVAQPLVVSVIGGQSLALPVPLRYTGSIAGSIQASGGTATWGSLTVLLEQLDGAYLAQQAVPAGAPAYSFTQAPPGTYRLRLASVPPGWALQTQPVFAYPAGSTVGQNLTLVKLGSASGHVYLDKNGNGQRNSSDPATSAYGVTLLNNAGQALLTVTPAADGSFSFPNLTPGVLYAVTANLGNGIGAPNASVTQWSGWFSVDSSGVDVSIGVFPYAWPDDQFNVVYGTVTAGGVPVGGAEVGYYLWKDGEGCDNPSGIQRRTRTDGNGRYQLQTIVLPFDLF
ncbi:MAG: hypothetical protein KC425_20555, partial [Anaerolineales bacterium]|nr:hypothetical protein [Anaerolineales bacterium]